MNENVKHWLLQIFATKLGWLIFTLFLSVVFGILANWYDWAEIAMFISWLYPVGLALVMMAYGWVINPIREYRENKKLKNK